MRESRSCRSDRPDTVVKYGFDTVIKYGFDTVVKYGFDTAIRFDGLETVIRPVAGRRDDFRHTGHPANPSRDIADGLADFPGGSVRATAVAKWGTL